MHTYVLGACLDPVDLPSGFYSCIGLVACEDPDEDFPATPTSGIYHVILFPFASAFLYSDILSLIPVILHVYS